MSNSKQMMRIIEEAANRHGVDANALKLIARIESSFDPKAVGPMTRSGRAQGLFQFVPATAKGYGLKDPMDPVQAADAAARYFKDLSKQFNNDLPVMLAQYNGGNAGARNARDGKLFEETAGYFEKYNRYAKELGINSRIDTSKYSVIPRPKKGKGSVSPNSPAPVRSLIEAQTSVRQAPQETVLDRVELAAKQEFADDQKTVVEDVVDFGKAAGTGFVQSNLTAQLIQNSFTVSEGERDAEWETEANVDNLIKMLKDAKVDREQWDYVLQGAETREGFSTRLERVNQMKEAQANMALSTSGALVGALAGGILDPVFWASGFAGAVATPAKLARGVKIAVGAAAGATVDGTASEVLGKAVDPSYTTTDTIINAAAGSLGGAIGAVARGRTLTKEGVEEVDLPRPPEIEEPDTPAPPVRTPEETPEQPTAPPEEPVDLPVVDNPQAIPEVPEVDRPINPETPIVRDVEWDAEWDEPERVAAFSRGGEQETSLLIPPNLNPKSQIAYIKKYGNEREVRLVSWMEKNMTNLDLVIGDLKGKKVLGVQATRKGAVKDFQQATGTTAQLKLSTQAKKQGSMVAGWAWPAVKPPTKSRFVSLVALRRSNYNSKGVTAELFMHETLHSMTTHVMRGIDEGNIVPNAALKTAYDNLKASYRAWKGLSKNDPRASTAYGLTNDREFIAELASEPFQATLTRLAEQSTESTQVSKLKALAKGLRTFANKVLGVVNKSGNPSGEARELLDSYYGAVVRFTEEANNFRKANPKGGANASLAEPNARVLDDASPTGVRELGEAPTIEDVIKEASKGTTFGKWAGGFGIENILQNPKVPPAVRALGAKLVGTTQGYREGSVVARSAWDDVVSYRDSRAALFMKGHHVQFNQWFEEALRKGQYGYGPFAKETAFKEFGELVHDVMVGRTRTADKFVQAAADNNRKWFGDWLELINNPGVDEGKTIRGLTMREVEELDPETGEMVKKLVGELPKDPNYVPFQLQVQKLNEVASRYGRAEMEKLFEEAFYSGNPNLKKVFQEGGKDYGKMFSRWYLKQVLDSKVNRKFDFLHSLETSSSGDELLESMLNSGIAREDAEQVVKRLLESNRGEQAFNSSLRKRSHFDRNYSKIMPDGQQLSIYDLVERDVARLASAYNVRMAGAVALAKNFEGVHSYSDFSRMFFKATEREFGEGQMTDSQVREVRNAFESAMNHILGRPTDETTNIKQALSIMRNVNLFRLMGGGQMMQLIDLGQAIGTIGLRNIIRSMPDLRGSWIRNKKTGRIANEELDAIEDFMGGAGTEVLQYMDVRSGDEWSQLNGYGKGGAFGDKVDFGSRKLAAGLLKYTGMTGITTLEKRITILAINRHFREVANGKGKMLYSQKRLAFLGLDNKKYDAMMESIRKFSTTNSRGRPHIDIRKWAETEPDTFASYRVMLQRESRRVIQENDLGAHLPAMDNGYFKSFTQFRSFVIQAWSKALLFGVNHADAQLAASMLYGMFFATMVQTGRAYQRAAGMEEDEAREYLDKALSLKPGSVLYQSVASIAQASLLPQMFDTIFSPFGNLFDGYRTTTDTSTLFANPTFDLLDRATGSLKQAAYVVTGQDTLDQRDFNRAKALLPFANFAPVSVFLGEFGKTLPKDSKAELLFDPDDEE